MDLRLVIGSLLFVGTTAAQNAPFTPAIPGTAPAAGAQEPAKQDPDKPQPTPAQQIDELTKEKARLQKEIDYARERAKNAKVLLREKFAPRTATHRAIDAGVMAGPSKMTAPPVSPPKAASIATAEELGNHPQGTMLIVNGRPIAQASYDQLMKYLGTLPNAGDEAMRSQRAMFELIRVESTASTFEDNEATERMGELVAQLEGGKQIGDLIKDYAPVAGGNPDGSIEVTRNSVFGPWLEMVAFETAAGSRSRPFRTGQGLVLLQTDKVEKGASPELDKVIGKAILVPYSNDPEAMNKAQMAISMGQVEIKVRDQKALESLPAMFRQMAADMGEAITPVRLDGAPEMATPAGQAEQLNAVLKQLADELAKPFDANDAAAKTRREALEKQYAEVKKALSGARDEAPVKLDGGAKKQD
ncbi:MAG: hypothetical protein MUC36_26270 [Planctomycetes bacterium]|jgi:hypothetical protein|nr:hypothetical protein [Planctomycetota bacterium]